MASPKPRLRLSILTSVWEKAFLERLPVEWVMDERQGEEFMAILGEMIDRQKSKGKRELRNLRSSVNYGDVKLLLGVNLWVVSRVFFRFLGGCV